MDAPPFNTFLGTRLLRRDGGTAEVELDLEPHHLNRRGVAHGGVIGALLDSALGSAVVSAIPPEWWCATTSISTQFLRGAEQGRLLATGRVLRRGSAIAFAEGEVRDHRDRVVARASGTWHLWPYKPGAEVAPDGRDLALRETGQRIRVGKIVAVGRNYAEHVKEMNAPAGRPVLFFKPPSALVHDGGEVPLPADAGEVHHEVELVVVIGAAGKSIPPERALDHVLGYAVGLDLTLRDLQSQAKQRGEPWCVAKGFDGSAPVSPITAREDVGDGSGLEITLDVNGERRQTGNTSQMLRSVPELIAYVSRWFTLEAGDLIFTGTPHGVGPVAPGDRVEARIERVGKLRVDIVRERD